MGKLKLEDQYTLNLPLFVGNLKKCKKEVEQWKEKRNLSALCGKLLHERNLQDTESIIYDNLYHQGGVCIASPKVQLYCILTIGTMGKGLLWRILTIWWGLLMHS